LSVRRKTNLKLNGKFYFRLINLEWFWLVLEAILQKTKSNFSFTFFENKSAWMIEEKVSEIVAVGVDAGLFAYILSRKLWLNEVNKTMIEKNKFFELTKTRWPKERKGLKCSERRLAFCYSNGAASNCKYKEEKMLLEKK
jgi:hypothetical protein